MYIALYTQVNIPLLKLNESKNRKTCEICSKLTIAAPQRNHEDRSGIFIANLEHTS